MRIPPTTIPVNADAALSCVHVIRSPYIGGLERQAQELTAEFIKLGMAKELIILSIDPVEQNVLDWHEQLVPVHVVADKRGKLLGIDRLLRLHKFFKQRSEPIVHFHYALPHGLIWNELWAAKLAGKKVIATLHHTLVWPKLSWFQWLRQSLGRCAIDAYTVTTQHARDLATYRLGSSKVWLVPCCITSPQRAPADRVAMRSSLGVSDSDRLVVTLGRIVEAKGIFDVVEIAKQLADEAPHAQFVIAGTGECAEKLAAVTATLRNVRYLGRVDDPESLFAAADLFVLPSQEEGFGLVFAEAGWQNTTSVAYDLPTVRSVIDPERSGWLVPLGNLDKLRDAIKLAIEDDNERGRRAAEAHQIAAAHRPEKVIPVLQEVYEAVAPEVLLRSAI